MDNKVLNQLASKLGERGDQANIRLAEAIAAAQDLEAIQELITALPKASAVLASDIIKTLYETGKRQPELISPHIEVFLKLLRGKNPRLIWGGMMALETVAKISANALFPSVSILQESIRTGSVITRDAGIGTLAGLASAKPEFAQALMPFLLEHLRTCRPASVDQHAEKIANCASGSYTPDFTEVLESRIPDLSASQAQRVRKLIKNATRKANDRI